jgi:phosphohistidine phosphatase
MRRLLLLRHVKADRSKSGGGDHDRVLADHGRADALKIGAYMVRHAFIPDHVVVSTAARTRETWALVATAFKDVPPVSFEGRIYEASPQAILEVIKETGPGVGTQLVIGHNPGLQELATMLIATGDVEARQRLQEDFPTGALAVINFALQDWSRLHPQAGRLEHFVTPLSLEAATD